MLDELVKFARQHYQQLSFFDNEQISNFFVTMAKTTLVRFDKSGRINGFAVWTELLDKIVFIAVACTGNRRENYREMMKYVRHFKKPIMVFSVKGQKWVLKQRHWLL
jgi:hypothetical protein